MTEIPKKLLWKADELKSQERAFTQRLNPNCEPKAKQSPLCGTP